ncbi:MAG: MotA/TolQ/ExbB proton channel family protein [Planctomycetia bacterium]|nr:MotA/TolQ/ExbB proton channel family protein [Planctomycetia bacterium]
MAQFQTVNAQAEGAAPVAAPPPPAAKTAEVSSSPMMDFLFKSPTGWVLIAAYLFFVGLMVYLIIDLRAANFMPADFIEKLDGMLANKQFKEGFELARAEPSPFGKVMAAGMARLSSGLPEARDAAEFMIESAKNRKDSLLGYMAVLGTLGPLIGLVGTVSGMIDTFAELGTGTTPNVGKLASGISHALNATLIGIFLSVLAIPVYTYFKNRLSRIVIDASLLADDLLTQTYYNSRKPDAGTASVPPVASVQSKPPPKA